MPTTNCNFVQMFGSKPILVGNTVITPPFVAPYTPVEALSAVGPNAPGGSGVFPGTTTPGICLDRVVFDLALTNVPPALTRQLFAFGTFVGGFAKNGGAVITLTGTTPINVDLLDLTLSGSSSIITGGDTTFATANAIIFNNIGAADLVVTIGASNGSRIPVLSGTSPGFTVPAGGVVPWFYPLGLTVDSTHHVLTCTPTVGGTLAVCVGGA